jgi:hypothetical protein
VTEIANDKRQQEKRELWYQHNRLERTRPLSLVFPEDSWWEIIDPNRLQVNDPFWRQWEWYLIHLMYRHEHIMDDFVIEPDLHVTAVDRTGKMSSGDWGLKVEVTKNDKTGAFSCNPPIKTENDIEKLIIPETKIDQTATNRKFDAVNQIFGDILPVKIEWDVRAHYNIIGEAATFRGSQQLMLDMYDRPRWLHELMYFFTEAALTKLKYLEDHGFLSLNNKNHFVDSGGIGYSSELPANDFDGIRVRPRDMWGHFAAQEVTAVSPAQHEEFVLEYQLRVMEKYGLNAYGCCEPYTQKFDMLKRIPRLRRVSVSPWCDINVAAAKLEDRYVYSWKPNPIYVTGRMNIEEIRKYVRNTLEAAKSCILEIVMKDTITIENDPERIKIWSTIVRQEIER